MLRCDRLPSRSSSLHTEAAGTAPPDAFGPFRVLHQIGAGTLGPVFRAYEPDQDRLVAVKLFRLDVPPGRVHQLVAELEKLIGADLTYANVAAPLKAGISGTSAYLAQDFVAADSLDILLRNRGPLPAAEAFRVVTQLADALDFAAAVDVLHGALHPRDVLVSVDDTRLTGLGISRALERIGLTATVRRPYTAPERTAETPWDRRADVFSLAALTYEMISGKRVTAIDDRAEEPLADVPAVDARKLRSVFSRALARDPAQRFETALDFAEALNAVLPLQPEPSDRLILHDTAVFAAAESSSGFRRMAGSPPVIAAPGPDLLLAGPPALESPPVLTSPPVPASPPAPPVEQSAFEFRETALERSRSAIWPLVLAVVVGLAVGFAGGFGVASRDQSVQTSKVGAGNTPAVAGPSAASTREFTEATVTDAPRAVTPRVDSQLVTPGGVRPRSDATAASGRILIRSTPTGAEVSIDGRDAGRTPATFRGLEHGPHTVRIARDGYATEERRVMITAARPAQSVTVELARARMAAQSPPAPVTPATLNVSSGGLFVDSRPPGASVFVDEKLIGTTPLLLESVNAGEHAVRLERDGYRQWTSAVRIIGGERHRVTASMER